MKITDTIARLLFPGAFERASGIQAEYLQETVALARRQGREDAERAQEQWNQTVVNAAGQQDSRRKYLEKELATVKGYAEDLARLVLRKSKNFNDNSVYPDDRALGFDGYGTVLTLATAEQSLKSKMGLPRHSNWRHKAEIEQQAVIGPEVGKALADMRFDEVLALTDDQAALVDLADAAGAGVGRAKG